MVDVQMSSAADKLAPLLIEAHRSGQRIARVPEAAQIATQDEAYQVQRSVAPSIGPVVGWKVGRRADRPATRAPLYQTRIHQSGVAIDDPQLQTWIVESELMFRFAKPLPIRSEPYSREEVLAAVGGVTPVFEIIESRYVAYPDVEPLLQLADGLSHGAMVFGTEVPMPADAEYTNAHIIYEVDGIVRIDALGGNPAGDILDLLVWTANAGIGLKVGDAITTGSYTGMPTLAPGATAKATFAGVGSVSVTRSA